MIWQIKTRGRKLLQFFKNRVINPTGVSSFGNGETTKCRHRLAVFCKGYGLDLGFGGDPITSTAIRIDLPAPYTKVGDYLVQLGGTAQNLYWFKNEVLDYVFSSHLLEDFENTEGVLREWLRVIKRGGKLIIFCPDEQRFKDHCIMSGQSYNEAHVHEHFSLKFVTDILELIGQTKVIYNKDEVDIYSWDLVCEKL